MVQAEEEILNPKIEPKYEFGQDAELDIESLNGLISDSFFCK